MATYQARRGGRGTSARLISIEEAGEAYQAQKALAPRATKEQYVEFFLTHDGKPDDDFINSVRGSAEMRQVFTDQFRTAIKSDARTEAFYLLTGTVLEVKESDVDSWAQEVVEMILDRNQTLQ